MKIDSIFSTFDSKIDSVTIRLDDDLLLSGDNASKVRKSCQCYTRLLVDVLCTSNPVTIWGKVSAFYNLVKTHPILKIQDCLDFIHHNIIIDGCSDLTRFKDEFFSAYGKTAKEIGIMTWSVLDLLIKSSMSRNDFALINLASACKFLSKLSLDLPSQEEDCITSYLECEDYIQSHSSYDPWLISELNGIIKDWLKDFNPTFLPVRHGSGSVADAGRTKFDKYEHLASDNKLDLGIAWLHGYRPSDYYPYDTSHTLVRTSKYITVPKSLTKRRGISMEPASLQYFQQGVMRLLYDYIGKKLPQIPLKYQVTNQICAYLGSKYSYYCTVDLSSASDLVSYKLVKELFKGTHLLKYLMCTRSSHTLLPDGRVVELLKFAPMGSALCFPIESIIFAACCEFTGRYAKSRWGFENFSYSTYGDDMIIDNTLYGPLCLVLNELGFKVNHTKSFHQGPFRESCGKEFSGGVDVTPVKYRLNVTSWDHISPNDYSAICSFANSCSQHAYHELRRFLLSKIVRSKPGPLFVDHFGQDPYIFSTHNTNFNNYKRWNKNLFREEVTYLSVGSRNMTGFTKSREVASEDKINKILFLEWLIQREYSPESLIEIAPDKYSLLAKDTIYKKAKYLL